MKGPSDRSLFSAAGVAFALCAAAPISNPDLFWHLSAARRMVELRAIPSSDWLSWTMPGAAWTDFEWLQELMYGVLHHEFGMAGLWMFKVLLMLAAACILLKTLKFYGVPVPFRATALAFWSAASLAHSDLRPEWFSVIAFALLFWQLEARRLGQRPCAPGWVVLFFGVWVNLHAGFAYGVLLIGIYAAAETLPRFARLGIKTDGNPGPGPSLWIYLAAAIIGTLFQPLGFALYKVLWSHWKGLGTMNHYIYEWGGIDLSNPLYLPYWILLFGSFGVAMKYALKTDKVPLGPLAALFFYSYSAFKYVRMAVYDVTLALPLSGHFALRSQALRGEPTSRGRWTCFGIILLCASSGVFSLGPMGTFAHVFSDRYVPVLAARFLEREKTTLSSRVFYNDQHGWGGYLAYKLYPDYRIFQDGRYIFHPILEEAAVAVEDAGAWEKFMNRRGIELAVMENIPRMLETTRVYPDDSERIFLRPYYVVYMPKTRWALIYWDDKALIFARRNSVPADWLRRHEYRYAFPFDREARDNALRRHEISLHAVLEEFFRHGVEVAGLQQTPD